MKFLPHLIAAFLAVSAPAAGSEPPQEFPSFDRDDAAPLLVVGTVRPGKYLPQFAECANPDTICIDPPPFWFEAEVRSTVYGAEVPKRIAVATTSHYGMSGFEHYGSDLFLISLLSNGAQFVMPRYAMADLVTDSNGELHLLVLDTQPLYWLPCSAWGLREEVAPEHFGNDLTIPTEDAQYYVEDHPELFHEASDGWAPRYSIKLKNLSAHLARIAPTSAQMSCEQESTK